MGTGFSTNVERDRTLVHFIFPSSVICEEHNTNRALGGDICRDSKERECCLEQEKHLGERGEPSQNPLGLGTSEEETIKDSTLGIPGTLVF